MPPGLAAGVKIRVVKNFDAVAVRVEEVNALVATPEAVAFIELERAPDDLDVLSRAKEDDGVIELFLPPDLKGKVVLLDFFTTT